MSCIFQIQILILMLWASGVGYAMHGVALNDIKIEVYIKKYNHIGSSDRQTVQVLDNDAISPELRSRIQLVAFALSLPQIGIYINDAVTTARNLRNQHPNDYDAVQEGLALRREAASRDLEGYPEAWEFVRTNSRGADAWEALITQPIWRRNRTFLEKVAEYRNAGLQLIEDGGDILVKQSDGIVIGKLDPNDILFPDEMRVFGVYCHRHFDPHVAGGFIQYKSWENPIITQNGINDITTHLQRFGSNADNSRMINRLQKILHGEIPITDYDKRFYTHEIEEYTRYRNHGIPDGVNTGVYNGIDAEDFYYNAHAASLETFQIDEITSPLYHP